MTGRYEPELIHIKALLNQKLKTTFQYNKNAQNLVLIVIIDRIELHLKYRCGHQTR
jgi:hypothetical protein